MRTMASTTLSVLLRKNRPQIKQDPSIFDAGNDRRIGCPQARGQLVSTQISVTQSNESSGEHGGGRSASADQ